MTKRVRSPVRWLLIAAFIVAAALTAFAAVRAVHEVRFWRAHTDEPIKGWMRIGFVAHAYHVPPFVLERALGLPPGPPPDRRRLARIAADTGVPLDTIKLKLMDAIVHARPPYPPPLPPTPSPPRPPKTAQGGR